MGRRLMLGVQGRRIVKDLLLGVDSFGGDENVLRAENSGGGRAQSIPGTVRSYKVKKKGGGEFYDT